MPYVAVALWKEGLINLVALFSFDRRRYSHRHGVVNGWLVITWLVNAQIDSFGQELADDDGRVTSPAHKISPRRIAPLKTMAFLMKRACYLGETMDVFENARSAAIDRSRPN